MELLIYIVPVFAEIIGSRYFSRLANFGVMILVFQLDLAILLSVMSGELRLRLLVPYTVVAIIPAMAGIIGGRYFGNAANTCLIIAVFYVASVLLAFFGTGQLRLLPPPGTRSCRPEIWSRHCLHLGCNSGVSAPTVWSIPTSLMDSMTAVPPS